MHRPPQSNESAPPESLKIRENLMQQMEQLSHEGLKEIGAPEIIKLIAELPESDADLKERLLKLLKKLYILDIDTKKENIPQREIGWVRALFANVLTQKKPEVVPQWKSTLHGKTVNVTLTRINETTLECKPQSNNGDWATINVPFRPEENLALIQWILENLPSELQEKLADEIAYTKDQVVRGEVRFYAQEAIRKMCFQQG